MVENPHFIAICVTSSSEFFRQLAGELYAVFVDERGEIHVEIPVEERGQVAVIVAEFLCYVLKLQLFGEIVLNIH